MQDIKEQVRQYLFDNIFFGNDAKIEDDTSFMKSHILDSTGFIEMVYFIEETFGIDIGEGELLPENLDSLNNIEAFVMRKIAETGQDGQPVAHAATL